MKGQDMKIMITSFRGDHNCEVAEAEVAEKLFNKLSGKTTEALPEEFKTKVPNTFQELEALWKPGKLGYTMVSKDKDENLIPVKEFDPALDNMLAIAMQQGG